MGLIFNLTIILCLTLHVNSSAQADANCCENFEEMMKLNDKISYLLEAEEKLKENNINLKAKYWNLEQQINALNETAVRENVTQLHNKIEKMEDKLNMKLSEEVSKMSEKMEEHVSGLKVNLGQVDQRINWLNETVERVTSVTKDCEEKGNTTQKSGPTPPQINQDKCNISEPSQLYHLSPDTLVFTWKDFNVSNTIQKEVKVMESEVFSLDKHGINGQLKIHIHSYSVIWSFLRFSKKQPLLIWPVKVYPRVTYVVKEENKLNIVHASIKSDNIKFCSSLRYDNYSYGIELDYYYKNYRAKYVANKTFSIDVHVETPKISNQFYSDNGTVKGSICPYGKIMEWSAADQIESIYSPYFYTSPNGYRAVVEFCFDNKVDNKWLTVTIDILTGLYDSRLKEPKWKGMVILINQIDASKSVSHVKEITDTESRLTFARPSNVNEFVMNDELKYEASIEIIN